MIIIVNDDDNDDSDYDNLKSAIIATNNFAITMMIEMIMIEMMIMIIHIDNTYTY